MSLQELHGSARARSWFGALLVLAFGLRALVPTGYMIDAVDAHARLVLCPAGLHQAVGAHHHHSGMGQLAGMNHAAHGAQHAAADCPFALASGAALVAAARQPAQPYFAWLPRAPAVAVASIPTAPPPRHHAPRGPPSLA